MMQFVSRHALILPLVDDKFILFNGLLTYLVLRGVLCGAQRCAHERR